MKPRPAALLLLPAFIFLSWLGRLGDTFAIVAEVLLVATTLTLVMLMVVRPQVRLRKRALPKPAIRLNIDGSSK
jgi:hypothetical protein